MSHGTPKRSERLFTFVKDEKRERKQPLARDKGNTYQSIETAVFSRGSIQL
jgi:hypothetical protein